jgi:hypothetical protein
MPEHERRTLVDLLQGYGRHNPTGTITIPDNCLQAVVHYTSRTPTHGHLRVRRFDRTGPEQREHGYSTPAERIG